MIIVTGHTGSGKTKLQQKLDTLGYEVIPIYTTRRPRPNDLYKVSVYDEKFNRMVKNHKFIYHNSYETNHGILQYGIPLNEYSMIPTLSAVVEGSYENIGSLKYYASEHGDIPFVVFLDVNHDTIIKSTVFDYSRIDAAKDMKRRLRDDNDKMLKLKDKADLVINNPHMELSPLTIAELVVNEYNDFIKKYKR